MYAVRISLQWVAVSDKQGIGEATLRQVALLHREAKISKGVVRRGAPYMVIKAS